MKMTKEERSWMLYDCGNSAYSIAITTALLPVYFGMMRDGSSMGLGYFNSLAGILVALLSPVLGTIADYKDYKKRFFIFFASLGVIFTGALAFVPRDNWQLLILFYILTAVGFSGSNVFYDSFLVDVSKDENMDKVSSYGYAFGYIASVIPFAISLGVVYFLGMDQMIGYQLGFVVTAIWWGLFTIPIIKNAKQKYYIEPESKPVTNSFKRLGKTFKEVRQHKIVFGFMIAYFFYIDGVGTIIKMCVPYAQSVLQGGFEDMFMMLGILLVIQIIAFPFAILYGHLANKYSAKRMIMVGIITYIIATTYAFTMNTVSDVFVLGMMIGSAQGGIQALSRSYYAKIIPKNQSNEFFGFYNVFGKFAAVVGPGLMATMTDITGDARSSILVVLPLFIIGLIIFMKLPDDKEELVDSCQ